MPPRVFVSCSFAAQDAEVVRALVSLFARPELSQFEAVVQDARTPLAERVDEKIRAAIDKCDIVAAVFTRRHKIEGSSDWTAPPYVVAEAAYALAQHKRLLLFRENEVPAGELGLANASGLEWLPFSRETLTSPEFLDEAARYVQSALRAQTTRFVPPHRYGPVRIERSIFPNGYATSRIIYEIFVNKPAPIIHETGIGLPSPLPPEHVLLANALGDEWPIPHVPFVALASEIEGLRIEPHPAPSGESLRRFAVTPPRGHRHFRYEIMFGSADWVADTRHAWFKFIASRRSISTIELTLRIHRNIRRAAAPRADIQVGNVEMSHDDALLIPAYDRAELELQPVSPEPFFRVYHLSVTDLPAGADLLVLY